MKQINDRKRELENEINRVEEKYSSRAETLQKSVESALKPVQKIRDKPFTAVGISIVIGFLAGSAGRKKRTKKAIKDTDTTYNDTGSGRGRGFTSVLTTELKRLAARKAMVFITEWVDQKLIPELTNRMKNKQESTEGDQNDTSTK